MKPVFIQSWTIPRKYLQSAYLPIAMSQMAAMKMSWFLPKKAHSTRNNDAFTHCGISLISPNILHQKYSGSLKSLIWFHRDSGTLFGPVFRRMTHIYKKKYISVHLTVSKKSWWSIFKISGISLINSVGPRTLPWGTPLITATSS